jgi:hypothetical protein
VSSVLAAVSPIPNDERLYELLRDRAVLGRYRMGIGSTDAMSGLYLVSDSEIDSDASLVNDDEALDDLFAEASRGDIDLNEVMLSATHAGKTNVIDAAHLSKIWRIERKTAERTLDVTSIQENLRIFLHGYLLYDEEGWKIEEEQHMLPIGCDRQRLRIRCPAEIEGECSRRSKTIHQGDWGTKCPNF